MYLKKLIVKENISKINLESYFNALSELIYKEIKDISKNLKLASKDFSFYQENGIFNSLLKPYIYQLLLIKSENYTKKSVVHNSNKLNINLFKKVEEYICKYKNQIYSNFDKENKQFNIIKDFKNSLHSNKIVYKNNNNNYINNNKNLNLINETVSKTNFDALAYLSLNKEKVKTYENLTLNLNYSNIHPVLLNSQLSREFIENNILFKNLMENNPPLETISNYISPNIFEY